ncbi:GAF domain-containing protein [Streptomyces sp. NPDC006140]|uniref:GAF domain-containing protein n=1 Tax=Streptomyces sp. NPDC006140 TaxID=3154579 RepID=UPI00340EDCFE
MPTFDNDSGRHDLVPADRELHTRMGLLPVLNLVDDQPVAQLDALASALAAEAADLVRNPAGFHSMVNIMKNGYQYFAGMYVPVGRGGGESQAAATEIPPVQRFMPRNEGWCVHTLDRRKVLPLEDIYDYPRWSGNGAVAKLGARTYLGGPLIHQSTDTGIGTICLVGDRVTAWGRSGVSLLKHYQQQTLTLIDELSAQAPHPLTAPR